MTDIVETINELRELDEDIHLFCPRVGEDGAVYYDEDIAGDPPETDPTEIANRKKKIKEAEDRKWKALKATEILAFDSDEAKPYRDWVQEKLGHFMQSCDVCVRRFHQARAEWKIRLLESYDDEDNVGEFLRTVDDSCLGRITKRLDEANAILSSAEVKQRGVRLLPSECVYAFFEALSCDALIRSEQALERHFDAPFDMVQTKKRLKVASYLPAMTRFLFCRNERRYKWANESWGSMKRELLKSEFQWAVRDHLVSIMMKVQMSQLDLSLVPLFWNGARLIVNRMDKELITESIRDLEGDFYRLMLDHLSLPSEGFLDLIETMKQLVRKSPVDFWDGMNAVTPSIATVVEQFFNSPTLDKFLVGADPNDKDTILNLDEAFSWIPPFLLTIKSAHLAPAVRPFANALFGRFQSPKYSPTAQAYCFKEGLKVLDYVFRRLCDGKTSVTFVGQPAVNAMLDMLSTHVGLIVSRIKQFRNNPDYEEDLTTILTVLQHAFQLEAQSLAVERQLITDKQPSPSEVPPSSPIWKTVLSAIDSKSLDLATHLLIAGRTLIGMEPLQMKASVVKIPPEVRHFNGRFEMLSQSITDIVDRMTEFDPKQLQALFEQPSAASAIISLLFSSTEDTRNSAVELLKVISGDDERRGALQHILKAYYQNVLVGISDSVRQVRHKKAFAPAPSMIRACSDIIDVMCNSQDGILRSRNFDDGDAGATLNFWKNLWDALYMIFATTEAWSNLPYPKAMMMDFCRDTMQFADLLFDQCSIFATALKGASSDDDEPSSKLELMKELLAMPAGSMTALAKWLRLRDEFLSGKAIGLISKLFVRLRRVSIEIDDTALNYVEGVLDGRIRAKLTATQEAELQQALETYLGRQIVKEEEAVAAPPKQASISKWMSTATGDKAPTDAKARLLASLTSSASAFKEKRDKFETNKQSRAAELEKAAKQKAVDDAKAAQQAEFKRRRQAELQQREKQRADAKAKAQAARNRGLNPQTAEAGSGLEGLGVLGKDQAAKGEGLMHSSDESSDDDDDGDIDESLFGIKANKIKAGPKTNIINEAKIQMPVKKKRIIRSVKDMRARLAPDLSSLHRTILGWDYFHDGDFPPKSRPDIYSKVPSTFRTPNDYQSTFEPLLTLEAWQGFVKAREESMAKPYEVRITSRASVDAFQEVGSTMTHVENRDIFVSEGDIILLSKTKNPSADEPTCLARVFRVKRKQQHIEVSYRVMPGNPLSSALAPNSTVQGTKLQSITPLEREYGALRGLQYYDLCDEIIRAKPSPLLTYRDTHTQPLIANYNVNKAQAKAIKSAIDNDAFTLIQGPPGSGKTKTITAIVGALLTETLKHRGTSITVPGQQRSDIAAKKLLVCAPSNAAVDELVMRFKQGIKTLNGEERKVNIVRLGRSDAIKADVQDVTLEELVNKKMGVEPSNGNDAEATRKLFLDHKNISEQLRNAYEQRDSGDVKGEAASKLADDIGALRRQKALLGTKIDNAKDDEKLASRNADLNRRRAQEAVLNDAHVICATLSGSGHEMFQGLSIEFETVIVDEAAQCVEMSALIPLKYGCQKCILVGDPKQLPPTVFSKEAARFQYEQSLFVRMQKNHPNDVHLLDTQYRMHPEISLFPSQTFYDGKLLDGGDMAGLRKQPWHKSMLLGPYRFFDVQGQHSAAPKGHSLINIAEINIAMQLYKRLTTDYPDYNFKGKVGIITPYKSQLRELKSRFTTTYGASIVDEIDFNTTDAFQGRESEVIIFSCVRASPAGGIGFLQDIRRMNVGLTRAKSSLWVLGNSQSLMRGEFWKKLVVDAKQRKRFTDGDLQKMLKQHSDNFPAPKEGYIQPHRPEPEPKSEPMSRDSSRSSHGSGVKKEIKEEPKAKDEHTLVHHAKRKLEPDTPPVETIKDEPEEDTDMLDIFGDKHAAAPAMSRASSNAPNGRGESVGSGRSTPAAASSRNASATPGPDGANGDADATPNPMAGMNAKPKIKMKRARAPPDPFIKQKKRPKMG